MRKRDIIRTCNNQTEPYQDEIALDNTFAFVALPYNDTFILNLSKQLLTFNITLRLRKKKQNGKSL